MSDPEERTLALAEEVARACEAEGVPCAIIGALALAAHNFPRATEDVDLATVTNPFRELEAIARRLRAAGCEAEVVTPDADDPLGGVLNVTRGESQLVQVVNFENPLASRRTPAADAIRDAVPGLLRGSPLRVVALEDLVALKLYAGGPKSTGDLAELLVRNQPLDLPALRATCEAAGLRAELDALLRSLSLG